MITEVEVSEWKIDPVTDRFMAGMKELEERAMYQLSQNRDEDVRDDFLKGYIAALRDVQDADFEVQDNG